MISRAQNICTISKIKMTELSRSEQDLLDIFRDLKWIFAVQFCTIGEV